MTEDEFWQDMERDSWPETIFRNLNPEEEIAFRKWARKNYKAFSPINNCWHPIVQDECQRINEERKQKYEK